MRPRFVLAAAALALAACGNKKDQAPPVQTATVQRQDIVVDVEATGVIQPINAVVVKSKASGAIIKMPVQTGSQVKRGDLLVQIDPRDVQNRYDQALAALQAAQASLAVAKTQKARADTLFQERVITAPELETAQLSLANAQSALVTARTNLEIAKVNLEDATVRAPIDGTVIDKQVSLGTVISSATASYGGGTTLLTMANLSKVMDSTLVNESDVGNLKPGQPATVTVDAYPNRAFHGTIQKIAPQATVQQSVTMFPVFITLDNSEGLLMPGMNSDVAILVDQRNNVLAVPNDAIRSPRDAAAAAAALGLDPNTVRQQLAAASGGQRQRRAGGDSAASGRAGGGGLLAATPQGGRGSGAAQRRSPSGGEGAPLVVDTSETPAGASRPHVGIVFVAQNGTFVPRTVRLGVGNYDYTEVLSGLQQGDRVALISAAMLQQARGQFQQRVRNMTALPGTQGAAAGGRTSAGGGSRRGGP